MDFPFPMDLPDLLKPFGHFPGISGGAGGGASGGAGESPFGDFPGFGKEGKSPFGLGHLAAAWGMKKKQLENVYQKTQRYDIMLGISEGGFKPLQWIP